MNTPRPLALLIVALTLAACATPAPTPTGTSTIAPPPAATATPLSTATVTASPEPSLTPTPALLDLEIVEWYEHSIPNLVDPSSGVTNVEVLIRNPNDVPVRIDRDKAELRFVNSAGEVVYANPSPFFYIWEGEWMTPNQTAALQACMCFESQGLARPEWESLELVAPLEITTPSYTPDVEVTAEFVLLEEVLHGYSGPGVATTLTNTSDQVLESISTLVFARDASGRYVGMASFGNAVVSFTEDIGIQPGDTASGFEVSQIDYLGNERLTYEVAAIGILAQGVSTDEPLGEPTTEWQGIPIMPGAISGGETDDGYEFTTQATIDEIAQFYEVALAAQGYSLTTTGEEAGVTFLLFQKGSTQAIVGILPVGGIHRVQISAGS
jgi:hypothetical protein